MCGIAGFLTRSMAAGHEPLHEIASRMADALQHRGPDDSGTWADPEHGIALGHRRLSVIDLSSHGHQPMTSASGRYVIVYNGEIYNFESLRTELGGNGVGSAASFRGHSDTEILLASIERWGVRGATEKFNGMFAFALWDRQCNQLYLVRDRLGEKPLYYGWSHETFFFASELKSLHAHPGFGATIDQESLALYTRYGYVPGDRSIFSGVKKLPPGTILEVGRESNNDTLQAVPYWSVEAAVTAGQLRPIDDDEESASTHLEQLLQDAIRIRMVADVPLGAFLSGGVDSSAVVALMQNQSTRRVNTFSIGFHESQFDEAPHAARVASYLGTDHTQLYVSPAEALAAIPELPDLYDEPFADSSQIPTFLVSRLARKSVTVALSGDGGDELFGGYTRHLRGPALWRRVRRVPALARGVTASLLRFPSRRSWHRLEHALGGVLERYSGQMPLPDAVHKIASVIEAQSFEELYQNLVSHWNDNDRVVSPAVADNSAQVRLEAAGITDFTDRMMFLDSITYLADDILTKLDRASMAVSLEARVPLLDHRIVEFVWRLPQSMKIRSGQGKQILRRVLYRHVPKELIERPKAGFALPLGDWLRGPLREWAESLLSEKRLREEGFFEAAPIRSAWSEHLKGNGRHQNKIWIILMFQAWLDRLNSEKRMARRELRARTSTAPSH